MQYKVLIHNEKTLSCYHFFNSCYKSKVFLSKYKSLMSSLKKHKAKIMSEMKIKYVKFCYLEFIQIINLAIAPLK